MSVLGIIRNWKKLDPLTVSYKSAVNIENKEGGKASFDGDMLTSDSDEEEAVDLKVVCNANLEET